jgi:hypothetical protein
VFFQNVDMQSEGSISKVLGGKKGSHFNWVITVIRFFPYQFIHHKHFHCMISNWCDCHWFICKFTPLHDLWRHREGWY